ncbi:MAG TPA: glutaredoxin family protein [Noviherbaspirillum sp.]|nr:glutaredoxin family protein [Noviherbaspirillum sp.]
MKHLQPLLPVLLVLCAGAAHAQLYKWVGPDGKVTYSDVPPPAGAKAEARAAPAATGGAASDLPYELAQAARNHPVVLYTTADCLPCDDGRKLLNARGIPFRERTVTSNEDIAQVRQLGGDTNLPLLTVGRARERGYEPNAWNNALTIAGYPAASRLPRNYRQPAPEPAAPRVEPVAPKQEEPAAAPAPATPPTELPPATGNAPPGFRF